MEEGTKETVEISDLDKQRNALWREKKQTSKDKLPNTLCASTQPFATSIVLTRKEKQNRE
jgi:hypothetical protein